MDNFDRLAVHTMTTKPWDLPTACYKYAQGGLTGMGVWRQWLEGRSLEESRMLLDDYGITPASLVRGGFFLTRQLTRNKLRSMTTLRRLMRRQ